MKISICCEMLPCRNDFAESVSRIKATGVDAVEFWKWTDKDLDVIKDVVKKSGIKIAGFCVDSENVEVSKHLFKCALNSGEYELLLQAVKDSVQKAKELGAKALIATIGDSIDGLSYEQQMKNVEMSLVYVKEYLEKEGIMLLVEPINPTERKTYIESRALPVIEILKRVGSPNIKLLYDIYHQATTGDLSVSEMIENIDYIGHIHVADVPGRAEPGTGDVDFDSIFKALKASGYDGYIGLECHVKGNLNDVVQNILDV